MHQLPLPLRKYSWYSFLSGWVNPRTILRLEGLCQRKIPVIPLGIEPVTRLAAAQPTASPHAPLNEVPHDKYGWTSKGLAPCVLKLDTRWRWTITCISQDASPTPPYLGNKLLDGPLNHSKSVCGQRSLLPGIEPWSCSSGLYLSYYTNTNPPEEENLEFLETKILKPQQNRCVLNDVIQEGTKRLREGMVARCFWAASWNLLDKLEKTVKMPDPVNSLTGIWIYIYIKYVFFFFLVKPETRGRKNMYVRIQLATGVVVGHSCRTHCGTWHVTI